MFRFGHVSDSHVRPDDGGRSRVIVEHLSAVASEAAAFVVHTGDLMDEPSDWAARAFRTLVSALDVPLYVVPGNHDVYNPTMGGLEAPWWARLSVGSRWEEQYRTWFGPSWYGFSHDGTRFLAVNTLVINSGLPEEEAQWRWLEAALAGCADRGERSVIFTHLPLFVRHPYEELDARDFRNRYLVVAPPGRDRLLELIRRHRVLAVINGHMHVARDTVYRWPEEFSTHFVTTGSSGCASAMAIEHFRLPVEPSDGLGFHIHCVDGDRFCSEYYRYVPDVGGRWRLGPWWVSRVPQGKEPPRQDRLEWNDPGYRPTVPTWQAGNGPVDVGDSTAAGLASYYVQHFAAESDGAGPTIELSTRDSATVYLNGLVQYDLAALSEVPDPWRSAGGTYTIDGPGLSLPLRGRCVRKGTNVLAIRLGGERAGTAEIGFGGEPDMLGEYPTCNS